MDAIMKFQTGDFTRDDCLKDGDFTPEFLEFLKQDSIGKMYLKGFIRQTKEDMVDSLLKLRKADDIDIFKESMKPYIKKFEDRTGFVLNEDDTMWRHCNDIAMMRTTLKFDRGESMCMLTVFEDRFSDVVNMDAWLKKENGVLSHWNHIDHCGVRSKLEDYFDRIIKFCK